MAELVKAAGLRSASENFVGSSPTLRIRKDGRVVKAWDSSSHRAIFMGSNPIPCIIFFLKLGGLGKRLGGLKYAQKGF
jgi:hypothetical protein